VELHGGTVAVKSEGPGHGSVFSVSVPGVLEETAAEVVRRTPPQPVPASEPSNILTIALVEDSDDIREMTEELLTLLGHQVASAQDGEEGVNLILKMLPDVAIVDLGLPGLDGCSVARRVRAALGPNTVRLVAMTGLGLDADRQRAHEAGFDGYLIKPADVDALVKALTPEA